MERRDLLGLIRPLKKDWLFILSLVIIALFLGHSIYTYQRPLYESQCLIKLDDTYSGFSDNNLYQDLDIFAENNDIATEVEVLKSDTILKKALEKLNPIEYHRIGRLMEQDIYKDHPFRLVYDSLSFQDYDRLFYVDILDEKQFRIETAGKSLKAQFGESLLYEGNAMKLVLSEEWLREHGDLHLSGRYSFRICSEDYLLKNFVKGNVWVKEVKEHVRVVRITFEGRNAQRVADFTNAIASSYLEDHIDNKMTAANLTEDFLDNRIRETANKLNGAERALENFRLNKKVLNLAQETETDLRKISQLEIQQTNLNMKLVVLDSLIKYVQLDRERFLQLAPSYESYGGLLFTELIKQLKGLEAERIELARKYAKGSEELQGVDQKIRNLVNYIQENINNHRKNSYAQLDKIEHDISGEKKSLESIPTVEKNLKRLERDFNNYQELYNFLTKKQLEAGIAKRAKLSFHRILNKAKVAAAPINPGKWFLMALAAFIALLVSIFLLYLKDFLSAKIWDVEMLKGVFLPEARILEEGRGGSGKVNFGLIMASLLKRERESSAVLAICPSNARIHYTHHFQQCLEALSASGEKILCLYWDEAFEVPDQIETKLLKGYLQGDWEISKLTARLKSHQILHERMDIHKDGLSLLREKESSRFKKLSKEFDRIVLFLPPPDLTRSLEILEPFYDTLIAVFQQGISRQKELPFFSQTLAKQDISSIAILLNEWKRPFFSLATWRKKLRTFFQIPKLKNSLSA